MYRQSPGRNHRSKGIKVKNVLQMCLLLAVCFWLIYQVKHSHDKKKEFDESDAKASNSDELIRLGRKDIQTRVGETLNKDENHDEPSDEEEINGEEVDENKHDEDEEEAKKVDVKDDDETDEHEQEKSDAEVDREVDGEEREDGDENEQNSEVGHGQNDKESSAEETDRDGDDSSTHEADRDGDDSSTHEADRDGDDSSTHEAREEQYKADDASSAVTHEHPENILAGETKGRDGEETYGSSSNITTSETKEDLSGNSVNGSSPTDPVTQRSNDHLMSNTTTVVTTEDHAQGIITERVSEGESKLHMVDSERANNSILNVNSTVLDAMEFPNSPNNSTSENVLISEESVGAGNNTETLLENNNEIEGEKSDISDGTDENLETSENSEEVEHDVIDVSDASNSLNEKDVRTDLETLPEIQTEGTNEEDAAE